MVIISIICTVKNGEKYLSHTVESILSQSFSDWEFIIVDDGSNDNTPEILKEYMFADSRIKVIFTDGVGRGRALNMAIENAQGEFIANIDADDLSHPQRLEIQKIILENCSDIDLLSTGSKIFTDDKDFEWEKYKDVCMANFKYDLTDAAGMLIYRNPIGHSTVMIRKSPLLAVNAYDAGRNSQFDYDLWVRLAEKGYSLTCIPLKLGAKRIHSQQSFENKRRLAYLYNSLVVQARAIMLIGSGIKPWLFLLARAVWGLIPQRLRVKMTKTITTNIKT